MPRTGAVQRKTKETDLRLTVDLDGVGDAKVDTGIPFFDHMLETVAKHGALTLEVSCKGDLHIDQHHTVEDTGIALGKALDQALGDRKGIARAGCFYFPLDEALARTVVDLSGRAFLHWNVQLDQGPRSAMDLSVLEGFFKAVADGEIYISPKVSQRVIHHLRRPKKDRVGLEALSQREFDLLRVLGAGMSLKECAKQLNISTSSASTYRTRSGRAVRHGNDR